MAKTLQQTAAVPGPTEMIEIRWADPSAEDLRPVVNAHLAHSQDAGPEESNHTMGVEGLQGPDMQFWALYDNGEPLACGALKRLSDGSAEVKSVHVVEAARGRGLARKMMTFFEETARQNKVTALVLETGADHLTDYDAARRLYERLGYEYCGPIPGYEPDPNSAFMRLDLGISNPS
mgnify:CR=1 FL=1